LFLLPLGSTAAELEPAKQYRTSEFEFSCPANFKVSTKNHGTAFVQIALPSRSDYWRDTIAIRKHDKKTEECDLPQGVQPDNRDHRKIAGRPAYAYSGEDAAMNRYLRRKGYFIEGKQFCWNFELTRTGRPYQKLDLSKRERKRLDNQSDQDSTAADGAFKMVLNSFVLFPRGR
jgi:hypothetical protein